MQATKRHRSIMMGVLVLGFGGILMTGACGAPVESACPAPSVDPPVEPPIDCATPVETPCMRYRIPLVGNPNMDLTLRAKYVAAFGTACYMSEVDTFDCFYKKEQMTPTGKACTDAWKIPVVFGAASYDKGYTCQPIKGTDDWWLQVGSDPANKIIINFQAAPRQSPLIDVNGTPTAVDGPYRNLAEPQNVGPGKDFYCNTVDKNGATIKQKDLILQVNRDANGGKIHSDLAGFTYPCGVDENCKPKTCTEPLVLKAGPKEDPDAAQVHHVVRRLDKRGCPWGTNSNKNAAVISARLNQYLFNKVPLENELAQINKVQAYMP